MDEDERRAYRERQREIANSARHDDRIVRNVTKIEDESDLEEFMETLEEYIDEDAEGRESPYWLKGEITVHGVKENDV